MQMGHTYTQNKETCNCTCKNRQTGHTCVHTEYGNMCDCTCKNRQTGHQAQHRMTKYV